MKMPAENFFKALQDYLDEHPCETEEELNRLMQEFSQKYNASVMAAPSLTEKTATTADDYLELSGEAPTKKKALMYAQKALALEPDHLDAALAVTELSAQTPNELFEGMQALREKATAQMEEQGWFDEENIGEFYSILETRPYMRVLEKYADVAMKFGMNRLAAATCEEMLRLCPNDNLGARYSLMHVYALLEEEPKAAALMKQYINDKSSQMLLPLSILYFKLNDREKAEQYLKRLAEVNKDTKRFIEAVVKDKMDSIMQEAGVMGYRPDTIEEYIEQVNNYTYLFVTSAAYFDWALTKLKKTKKKKS